MPGESGKRTRATRGAAEKDDDGNKKKSKVMMDGNGEDEQAAALRSSDPMIALQARVENLQEKSQAYYASRDCAVPQYIHRQMPLLGMSGDHVKERILQMHELDNRPRLNTSSYVNVVREPAEEDVALMGLSTNLADASVYPASVRLHDTVVNMIAKMWNVPEPEEDGNYSGAGTVGSTEACLLAGLALKFRWRTWYKASKYGKDLPNAHAVIGVVPNVVISTCYQAAWEKFFRYFDVEPRFIKPTLEDKMRINPKDIEALCDEKTIGVVGILGNHYNGAYDPIWDMNDVVTEVNKKHGYQIGIHVDAASGGFIAPFQDGMPPFDFRLSNVLSISASGHKFGESCCGTGWLVFRHRHDLAEHIAVSVSYLGGKSDSMTLNFSRPATAVYVQLFKFLRLGQEGYKQKVAQQMAVAKYLRDALKEAKHNDKPRFEILDCGDEHCLPVVAARLNPKLGLRYNDIDLQHALSEHHWYVSGYSLNFEDPTMDGSEGTLCVDTRKDKDTMFRVVVKSNLTLYLMQDLVEKLMSILPFMDQLKGEYMSFKKAAKAVLAATMLRDMSKMDDKAKAAQSEHHHLRRLKSHNAC